MEPNDNNQRPPLIPFQPFYPTQQPIFFSTGIDAQGEPIFYFFNPQFTLTNQIDKHRSQQELIERNRDSRQHNQLMVQERRPQEAVQVQVKIEGESQRRREKSKQKFGRNIFSNMFHMMLRRVSSCQNYHLLVERVIRSNNMLIKVDDFLNLLKEKMKNLPTYLSVKKINRFWSGPKLFKGGSLEAYNCQLQFAKILRISGKAYLKQQHMATVIHSARIKRQSWSFHLQFIRKFLNFR